MKPGFPLWLGGLAGAAGALLSGCTVGPDYHRPAAVGTNAMPAAFTEPVAGTNLTAWKPAEPAADRPRGSWWEVFGDAELNRLEALASGANQQLAVAAARFQQARAVVNVARSGLFPNLSADPSFVRQRASYNQPQSGHSAGATPTFNNFTVPLTAGWELDLWGRVRREVEASRARLAASADDVEAVKLAVQAELATDYFALRSSEADAGLLRRTIETYRRSLELTRNRRAGGIATDLDVSQAESQLRGTEAELPAVELRRNQLRNAIATLCGEPAMGFVVAPAATSGPTTPVVPVSLPAELLERRPDIAAAERRMAGANADVGVAQAAFYPQVRLSGVAGFQSVDAGTLLDWPSRLWALGPSVDLPIFTGGRNRAQLAATRAAYDEAVAYYRQTVLAAFQEVEDQLAAQRLLAAQLEAERAALAAAQRTLEIANNRYQAGLVTYLEVAVAQSAELARERATVELEAQRKIASVGLIKSLGGRWENR